MLGAAAGGLARYVVSTAVMQRFQGRFPLGTLVVNVTGCFLIGLLMTWFTERTGPHPYWRLLLVTGVLGGYTTFSSFAWETFESLNERFHAEWISKRRRQHDSGSAGGVVRRVAGKALGPCYPKARRKKSPST